MERIMRAFAYVLRILVVIACLAFVIKAGLSLRSGSLDLESAFLEALLLAVLAAPVLYAWVLKDESKRLSEASSGRDSRAKFRALLDSVAESVIIVDRDGRISDMNRMAEATFGYERTELLRQPIEYLLPERFREGHVGHREEYMTRPRRLPLGIGRDLVARRRDGSEFPVEISLSPIASGSGMRVLALVTDISQRKRLERDREESNADVGADEAVLVADLAGNIQFVNRTFERITGYSFHEVIGKNPRILKSGLQAKEYYTQMWTALRAGRAWESRLINRRRDGSLFYQDVIITPILDTDGNITHFISIGREVNAPSFEVEAASEARVPTEGIGRSHQ
jgi:PAS domain S-box-containing protein